MTKSSQKDKITPRKQGLQSRAQDTINVILEATTQLLSEKGLKSLSTNKIVEKAGVSIGSLYQYFPSKESILSFLIEKQFNKNTDELLKILEDIDLKETGLEAGIKKVIETYFLHLDKKAKIHQELLFSVISIEHLKFMLKNDQKMIDLFNKKLSHYENEIDSTHLEKKLFLLIYALKGIQFGILFSDKKYKLQDLINETAGLIFHFIKKK